MTAETLRKMAEDYKATFPRAGERWCCGDCAKMARGKLEAYLEILAILEAEQSSTAADAAAPQRGPQSAHPTDLGHPQGHDAANRYAARGKP